LITSSVAVYGSIYQCAAKECLKFIFAKCKHNLGDANVFQTLHPPKIETLDYSLAVQDDMCLVFKFGCASWTVWPSKSVLVPL